MSKQFSGVCGLHGTAPLNIHDLQSVCRYSKMYAKYTIYMLTGKCIVYTTQHKTESEVFSHEAQCKRNRYRSLLVCVCV